jgi:uncharacterized protein (DUF4415 family)
MPFEKGTMSKKDIGGLKGMIDRENDAAEFGEAARDNKGAGLADALDSVPDLTDDFWAETPILDVDRTHVITLRVKQSVLDAFKRENPKGYQTRINLVLESYVAAAEKFRRDARTSED